MAAIGSDGTVCSMTSYRDVYTKDMNVFFNELKSTFSKNKKYFLTYDVWFLSKFFFRGQVGIMTSRFKPF